MYGRAMICSIQAEGRLRALKDARAILQPLELAGKEPEGGDLRVDVHVWWISSTCALPLCQVDSNGCSTVPSGESEEVFLVFAYANGYFKEAVL
jgi:hypothetical protein